MQTPESESSRAPQVCANCKVRKRKCDKALPQCSHCINKRLVCTYTASNPTPPPLSNDPWYASPPNAPSHRLSTIDPPTILFLDPNLLPHTTFEPSPPLPIPPRILSLLGPPDEILTTTTSYFSQIHPWLPIISKHRVQTLYLHLPLPSHPDIALLFLAQKLITTLPPASPLDVRTPLYGATKHFFLEVENSGVMSVPVLQAGVLIALYEIGHGVYPAAYLSVGACARYAFAMGMGGRGVGGRRPSTMVEVEERRRVYWGVVILDRFVSIGSPGRPFATAEPGIEEMLPGDDGAWDEGIVSSSTPATVSSPLTSHMSKFALLCQAARLLGQVLTYVATEREGETEVEAQLDRTLHSMLKVAMGVKEPDYDQITFIFSALVALHVPTFRLSPTHPIPPSRLARALSACKLITEREALPNFMRAICPLTTREPRAMSPWGSFFAYQICGVYLRAEERSEGQEGTIEFFKGAFETLGEGWRVAGVYLRMLEVQEVVRWG